MFGLSSVIPYVSSLKCIFHHSSMVNIHIIALKVLWTVIIEKTPGVLVKGMRGRGKGMDIETLQKPVPLVRGRGFGGYGYGYGLLYPGVTPAHHYTLGVALSLFVWRARVPTFLQTAVNGFYIRDMSHSNHHHASPCLRGPSCVYAALALPVL